MLNIDLCEFYHSSPMREGVVCWYPFDSDASVLDLSGGALTNLLKNRCASVKKDDAAENGYFDYIVAVDPEDFSVNALKNLYAKLGPHGRLLIAYENPFALRFWAGRRASATGLPYDTLFGYGDSPLPSKAELQTRLKLAGFGGQKWYYPLTDHWFTREVYSESCLPNEYLNQRFIPYIEDDEYLQFDERLLYREIVRGGAFEFMCGAYLVEACVCAEDAPCTVDYAAVTAYREPAKRFATIIRNDGSVLKTPLHQDGRKTMLTILCNHEELSRLGINVVSLRLEEEGLVMPRLNLPTLWDYWANKLSYGVFDKDEMFSHFDRIRDAIIQASANGKCYWELVPANCFYNEQKDEFIFFDQEYCWENCSTDIAVVRAIASLKFSFMFLDDPHSDEWLAELKARYGLAEKWDELFELAGKKTEMEVFGGETAVLEHTSGKAAERAASIRRRTRFRSIPDKLRNRGFQHPILYGYGKRGKDFEHVLKCADMKPAAIVDQKLCEISAIEQVPPEARVDVVIVSMLNAEKIADDLKCKTGLPIFTLEELLNE